MHSSQGRNYWTKMLPHVVQAINSTHPYQSSLSRIHLLFSPMYYSNEALLVPNPVLLQSDCYEKLMRTRFFNLLKKANMGKAPAFRVGQYVLLKNDNLRTIQGSRQLITPICRDIYQVLTIEKGGFAFRVRNTRNRSERTVIHTELRTINLKDILI